MRARPNKQKPKRTRQPVSRRETAVVPEWLITSISEEFPEGLTVTGWTAERSRPHADAFIVTATVSGGDMTGVEEATWLTARLKTPGPIHSLNDLAERLTNLPRQGEDGRPGPTQRRRPRGPCRSAAGSGGWQNDPGACRARQNNGRRLIDLNLERDCRSATKRRYARQDSNLRPLTPEASALSPELRARTAQV